MQALLEQAIFSTLSTHLSLAALVDDRIFVQQAPLGTAAPLVVFEQVAGGYDDSSPRLAIQVRYRVVCISPNRAEALDGSAAIESALLSATLTLVGWSHYATVADTWVDDPVTSDGTLWYQCGAVYTIGADKVDGV